MVTPKPVDQPFLDACNMENIFIDSTAYGATKKELKIKVITPKNLKKDQPMKALIHLHGGGMIMFDVEQMAHNGCRHAVAGECIVFMPDFENAPEQKCPGFIFECYAGLKWVHDNAAKYNIDKKRISLTGESSGGYLVSALGYHLARSDESHLVKTLFVDIPMVSYKVWFEMPDEQLNFVASKVKKHHIACTYILMTEDLEQAKQTRDPYVFPAEMPEDIMAKLPPVYLTTKEHENFR